MKGKTKNKLFKEGVESNRERYIIEQEIGERRGGRRVGDIFISKIKINYRLRKEDINDRV